jgi:hypothetical protein
MRPEEEPPAEQMAAWNKDFPKWRYTHLSNFHRDCRKAQQRLLAPDNQAGF